MAIIRARAATRRRIRRLRDARVAVGSFLVRRWRGAGRAVLQAPGELLGGAVDSRRKRWSSSCSVFRAGSRWLTLGGPAKCPGELQSPTSPAHGLALVHIETSSLRWIRLIKPSPALVGCGRRGPAVARQRRAPRLAGGVSGRLPRVRTGSGRPCAAGSCDRKTIRA